MAMTKLITASLYFNPAAIFFHKDSIFELKVPKGLLKLRQKFESQAPRAK